MKNAVAMLLLSLGVPMLLMGDEMGRTQCGNHNTYCQDNELNWLDWRELEKNADLFAFFKNRIAFRMAHPALRSCRYLGGGDGPRMSWHSGRAWQADWSSDARTLAFLLDGP